MPAASSYVCMLRSASLSLQVSSGADGRAVQQLVIAAYDSFMDGGVSHSPSVHLSNVTLQCDPDTDASFSAATAVAIDSPTFLSAVRALSLLGLDARLMVEGLVVVSNETGWPLWPRAGIIMGDGADLHIGSETGRGVIDFSMNADRIILPYTVVQPGHLHIDNLKFVNLCATIFPLALGNMFPSLYIFGFEHSW